MNKNMIEELLNRIQQRLTEIGKSERRASIDSGLSEDGIRKLRKNEGEPTLGSIYKLAKGLETTPEWIAFGIGGKSQTGDCEGIPTIGELAHNVWMGDDSDSEHRYGPLFIGVDSRFPAGAQYAMVKRGVTMNNVIQPGEIAHCVDIEKAGITIFSNDIVIVERRNASGGREISAKRYIVQDGKIELHADSHDKKWKNYKLPIDGENGEQVKIVGLMLRVIKELVRSRLF